MCRALPWVELSGICFGGESASRLAVEVGDGTRCWGSFWLLNGNLRNKSLCGGRGFRWGSLTVKRMSN